MNNDTGTFHTDEEMEKHVKDAKERLKKVAEGRPWLKGEVLVGEVPSFTLFEPGEILTIKEQEFVVCRTKNDRLILRSVKLAATGKEVRILERWKKERRALLDDSGLVPPS